MTLVSDSFEKLRKELPGKFVSDAEIFRRIRRGDRIFIGTGCGEPQHLVNSMLRYVDANPKAICDAQVIHVWVFSPSSTRLMECFRHNSFFITDENRDAINEGNADYSPVFLSKLPSLFYRHMVPIDVALVQTSSPDEHGYMSLGVSVDIVKAATDVAGLVVAQVNANMPRVHGDGFINVRDVDFIVPFDEPLLEFKHPSQNEAVKQIGKYVSDLIEDGDTIEVGFGSVPNSVLSHLYGKRHLGAHSEMFPDGLADLMRRGVIDNTRKTINRGRTVASFCIGNLDTYRYIHDNPAVEFRTMDYTNNPMTIAQHDNMVAINSALEIDLTGQATADSIGKIFYSGIWGQADFMRGAVLSRGGKTILTLESTAEDGKVSRIVPFLAEGAGVTLNRGDIHYVVTEHGIAYIHGKTIRERAMDLIAIADPRFRSWLIEEAKKRNLIYKDQKIITGEGGEYPSDLETYRTTRTGLQLFLRPIKINDEPLLRDFFCRMSDDSLYRRFMCRNTEMPHCKLQEFTIMNYTREMGIMAVIKQDEREEIVGAGRYYINENLRTAEIAFEVKDEYQNMGIATELLAYLTLIAQRKGLLGFSAEVLADNEPMLRVFEKAGFNIERRNRGGIYEMKIMFRSE